MRQWPMVEHCLWLKLWDCTFYSQHALLDRTIRVLISCRRSCAASLAAALVSAVPGPWPDSWAEGGLLIFPSVA